MARTWCCPFWQWERPKVIRCEAGRLDFSDNHEMHEYADLYCSVNPEWEHCTLAQCRLRSYERKFEREDNYQGPAEKEV